MFEAPFTAHKDVTWMQKVEICRVCKEVRELTGGLTQAQYDELLAMYEIAADHEMKMLTIWHTEVDAFTEQALNPSRERGESAGIFSFPT